MTKSVKVGNLKIGGGAPISIQSMLSTPFDDFEGGLNQAKQLASAGCDIIRVAIPNMEAVPIIHLLKENVTTPIVADIHFDYRLALASVDAGVDKIRINPGNIGDIHKIKMVADACRRKNIPIRIGVNSGSLQKDILAKYGSPTAQALAESALEHIRLLNQCDFDDIVISLKSSNPTTTINAYRLMAEKCDYPLHLGVTEAGTERMGIIKSAIGIGSLLADGIGDTIRVTLTCDPLREIFAARDILKALGFKGYGANLICCPTCGRTQIDLFSLANEAEKRLASCKKDITVAIMGCMVNGPGEAREADIGIAGGKGVGVIFQKGEILGKFPAEKLIDELFARIDKM